MAISPRRSSHGATFYRNIRMGVSELAACVLSRKAGPEKISLLLRDAVEHGRGQFHLPAASQRNHNPELDGADSAEFPLCGQSAPGNHAYQAVEGGGGFRPAISG